MNLSQYQEFQSVIFSKKEKASPTRHVHSLSPKRIENEHYLPIKSAKQKMKTLVLDLDETLVHSTFDKIDNYDFKQPIELEGQQYEIYVRVRPGVKEFLEEMSTMYEIIIYTASLEKYALPLISRIDKSRLISYNLYREHCLFLENFYIKDLSKLGRDLKNVIIIDNCIELHIL